MTALNSYSTGTATVSAGGTTVTGTGTIWSGTNVKPGDILQIGNFQTVISDVTDTTHLVIPPWGGGAQTAVAYKIWQVSPQRFAGAQAMATVNELVAAFNTSGFYVFVDIADTVPDPSLGDDGQFAFQPTTGKTWERVAGVWTYLGIYKAFQLKGAWSGATAYAAGDVVTLSGSSYACVLDHTNHTPPNTTYWQLLSSIGATGAAGTNGTNGTNGATGATGAGYGGTSTTSLTIGTGSKAFTTQAGLAYTNGARVRASSAANTSNWMEGVATYSGTTLTMTSDKTNGSGTLADWNLNLVGQPGAGDLSSANALSELTSVAATARANIGVPQAYGQCRLTLSGGNLVLAPFNGNMLTIAGATYAIPDAGVSLAASGLTPGVSYYIYAHISSGSLALSTALTGHSTSTTAGNKGTEIQTGDNTATLVGMARVVTGPAWQDGGSQIFVLSWFNRSGKTGKANNTATRAATNASLVELNSEMRVEFLTWADEVVEAHLVGSGYVGTGSQAGFFAIGFDGATPEPGMAAISDGTPGALRPVAFTAKRRLSEGYHYATVLGGGNASTAVNLFFNSAADGLRSALVVGVKG